ncbi:hypothetical protein PSHT_08990 [Puccinia striiformis]|uniref:Uncharacterized protein n=1 Tax=Puccinia striiformis TaxID=27350 RepID=A0A2S4VL01_9BASI|nr:hypothetical protein PSHT_08990 [Puccinia striiformis]
MAGRTGLPPILALKPWNCEPVGINASHSVIKHVTTWLRSPSKRESPAGYHSAAESWRIHRLGSEPANLPPQTIQCTAKFKLFFPKKGSPNGYETFASNGDFSFSLTAGSMSFDEFRSMVAKECENNREGRRYPEHQHEAGFLAWINVIVELGNDTTNSCLELVMENPAKARRTPQAEHQIRDQAPSVPPSDQRRPLFPLTGAVLDIWAKALEKCWNHERDSHRNSPSPELDLPALIEPNEDLLRKYIELVIKPEKQEMVLKILVEHDVAHTEFFQVQDYHRREDAKMGLDRWH